MVVDVVVDVVMDMVGWVVVQEQSALLIRLKYIYVLLYTFISFITYFLEFSSLQFAFHFFFKLIKSSLDHYAPCERRSQRCKKPQK